MDARCRACKTMPFGRGVRKIRGRGTKSGQICVNCFVKENKPYKMKQIVSDTNPCGGIDMYTIHPKNEEKVKIRLHNLAHYEFGISNRRPVSSFRPIKSWEEVWKCCAGWADGLENKFRGRIQRGIMQSDGNECFAFIEHNDQLFFVRGIWG